MILAKIEKELKQNVDLKYKEGAQNFFKEDINLFGVRTPVVRKIANKFYREIEDLKKNEKMYTIVKLLITDYSENATIAFSFLYKMRNELVADDFSYMKNLLSNYVNNWAKCDDYCVHVFGWFIFTYPELYTELKKLTKSQNRWEKRAAAVTLIYWVHEYRRKMKKGEKVDKSDLLYKVFDISNLLKKDMDDLVQKGFGWLLKETSNIYPKEILEFVKLNKNKIPRVALRYAIEKYSKKERGGVLAG